MHEQTTVVPLALSDGVTTNLTVHLHLHVGPATAPVNGEPPATAPVAIRVTTSHEPTTPRIAASDRPSLERRMSPPRPERPVEPNAERGTSVEAPTDVADAAFAVLTSTGFDKRQARRAVEAAIGEGATGEKDVLRRAFQLGRTPGTTPPDANLARDEADREVLDREQCASIAAVSSRLTHRERVGFLCRLEGLSHRAIARRMGLTIKAVEKQQSRIRRKLSVPDFDTFVERFRAHKANHGSLLCRECVWNCAETFASDNKGETT